MGAKLITQEEADRIDREERRKENYRKFCDICPKPYQNSDPSRLDTKQFLKVAEWKFGRKGMMISGYMRTGKTRAVWALIKRLMVEEGNHPKFIKATRLNARLYGAYTGQKTGESAIQIVNEMAYCKTLIIDDLGKEPMTQRYLSYLYEIIDLRSEFGRPMVITTNLTPEQFVKKIGDETISLPLIERIKESCELVEFKKLKEKVG